MAASRGGGPPRGPPWPRRLAVTVLLMSTMCISARSEPATVSSCPPLVSASLEVDCTLDGGLVDCASPGGHPAGTRASFRCKPLYQLQSGYEPPAGHHSVCTPAGHWSVPPYRCVPICGRPTGKALPLIKNGTHVMSAADFPWHVILYKTTPHNQTIQFCGGSLIAPKFFLSAAHCFFMNGNELRQPISTIRAALGKIKKSAEKQELSEQFREIAAVHQKGFGGHALLYNNDIALVEMSEAVRMTAWTLPVCLDWELQLPELRDGEIGMVAGHGITRSAELDYDASQLLRFAGIPFVEAEKCAGHNQTKIALYGQLSNRLCFSSSVNNETVEPGDSGGGIAFCSQAKDRSWFLHGVVSVGKLDDTGYSIATKVASYIPWIRNIIPHEEVIGHTCGADDFSPKNIRDGDTAKVQNFPWEVDVFFSECNNGQDFSRGDDAFFSDCSNGTYRRIVHGGTLISPNLIVTGPAIESAGGRLQSILDFPLNLLRVVPRQSAFGDVKGANVSEVVRIANFEVLQAQAALNKSTLVLLELKKPLNLMPACVDLFGGSYVRDHREGTAMFADRIKKEITWKQAAIQNQLSCRRTTDFKASKDMICLPRNGTEKSLEPRNLFVYVDNAWFLRGVVFSLPDGKSIDESAVFLDMSSALARFSLQTYCESTNLCETFEVHGRPKGIVKPGINQENASWNETKSCPPLLSSSVDVDCTLEDEPFNCAAVRSPPGTEASFRCKPLYQLQSGEATATDQHSVCTPAGRWSVPLYRCQPRPPPEVNVNFNIASLPFVEQIACFFDCDKCTSLNSRPFTACWPDVKRRDKRCGYDSNRFSFERGSDRCYCCP